MSNEQNTPAVEPDVPESTEVPEQEPADPVGTGAEQQDALEEAPHEGVPDLTEGIEKLGPKAAAQRQFPSLNGQPAVEVAERSADQPKTRTNTHRKVFVLLARDFDEGAFDHGPNRNATRQFMVDHGLRPDAEVEYVGSELLADGKSIALAYEVEAVPAVVATDPALANVVVAQD